jgi:hypothetical protein
LLPKDRDVAPQDLDNPLFNLSGIALDARDCHGGLGFGFDLNIKVPP